MKLFVYCLSRYSRRAQIGPFTRTEGYSFQKVRRKQAEFDARKESRAHPLHLVVLSRSTRDGERLCMLVNGRPVHPGAVSISTASMSRNRAQRIEPAPREQDHGSSLSGRAHRT